MRAWIYVIAAASLAACTTTPQRELPPAGTIAADAGGAVGYQHGVERSRFSVGKVKRRIEEFGFLKVVGATGTFAVDVTTGAATGVPKAPRLAVADRAAPVTPEQHNRAVLDYFISAGIPADQIAGVDALTLLAASGETRSPEQARPTIIGYQSALTRHVAGVPVGESVAWARIIDDGVLSEGLYWPPIPAKAISEARRFQERLADERDKAAFLASLPPDLPQGVVVIHHRSPVGGQAVEAFASYDTVVPVYDRGRQIVGGTPATYVVRHFDIDGKEIRLPQEQQSTAVKSDKRPPTGR